MDDPLWRRRTAWLLGGLFIIRLAYALVWPLELPPDVAYYWEWGRRLDWGYFSKPPMIGWLMGLVGRATGDSELALRIVPLLLGLGALGFLAALARPAFGDQAAFWTVAALALTPAHAVLCLVFTIDPPLFFAWSAALYFLHRWSEGRGSVLPLMVAVGLGALTKQMMLVFIPLTALFLATDRELRRRLGQPGFWLMAAGALLFLLPPLLWNWRHDWITFRHTAAEIEAPARTLGEVAGHMGSFIGAQAGLATPILWLLLVWVLVAAAKAWRRLPRTARLLWCFSGPGLGAFFVLSMFQEVNPNWPLVFYAAGFTLLAAWGTGAVELQRPGATARRWFPAGVALGGVLLVIAHTLPFILPRTPWAGTKKDPTRELRGWRPLAEAAGRALAASPRPERTVVIVVASRQTAAQLGFYLPGRPRVYRWENPAHIHTQYGMWGGPTDRAGWDALVVSDRPDGEWSTTLREAFSTWEAAGQTEVSLGPAGGRRRAWFFRAGNLRGWPLPPGPLAGAAAYLPRP
ncbi:MAG: ArnT family glycosyltransferase [Limisphaerales bacterium]